MAHTRPPRMIIFYIFRLFLCIFIQCVGATSGLATIIPTPTLNVTSLTYSACPFPPSSCPLSDDDRDKHIACLFNFQGSCPPGWTFFCDDKSSDYLVEGCLERHTCPKGKVNYIDFDPISRTTTMRCKICQKYFIQRKEHDSAVDYITGCDTKGVSFHILQNLDKMVQVIDGGTTDYSQYVCDTSKGYSETHGITLCNVSNDCICDQSVSCDNPEFPVLLPNGKCDKQCAVDRDNYVICKLYEINGSIKSTKAAHSSNSIHVSNPAFVTKHDNAEVQLGAPNKTADSSNTSSSVPDYWLIIWISVVVVVVLVGVGVFVYKWILPKYRRYQKEKPYSKDTCKQKNKRCQQIKIKGGKGKNIFNFMNGSGNGMEMANFLEQQRKDTNGDSVTDLNGSGNGMEMANFLEQQRRDTNGDSVTDLNSYDKENAAQHMHRNNDSNGEFILDLASCSDKPFSDMSLIPPKDHC